MNNNIDNDNSMYSNQEYIRFRNKISRKKTIRKHKSRYEDYDGNNNKYKRHNKNIDK